MNVKYNYSQVKGTNCKKIIIMNIKYNISKLKKVIYIFPKKYIDLANGSHIICM